jgi:hypothetical protein
MSPKILASAKGSKFPPAREGTHVAILTTMVDVGLQEGRFGTKREMFLGFEITDEFNEWTDKDGPRREPKRVFSTVTLSLSEKATLRAYLEGILARRLSEVELHEADIVALVSGKPCLVHVKHTQSNGNTYANIGSIAPLPSTMPVPTRHSDLVAYTPEEHDPATWEKLPKFLQEKIAKRITKAMSVPKSTPTDMTPFNDDIPF